LLLSVLYSGVNEKNNRSRIASRYNLIPNPRHSIQPVTNAILLKLAPKILDLSSNQSWISCLRWMPPDTLKYLVVCQWPTCQHRQVIEDQVLKPSKSYDTVRNAHLLVADIYLDSTVCHANHGRRIEAVPNAIVYRIDP